MNRRRTLLLSVVGLGLVGGVVFLCWPKKSDQPLRLKIVGRAVEQGKQVVFFRVESADRRRMRIDKVERALFGGATDNPFERSVQEAKSFWAPSQVSPLDDQSKSRDEFGVLEPPNAESWKLRAWVSIITPNPTKNLQGMQQMWQRARSNGKSFFEAACFAWRVYFSAPSEIVEHRVIVSDPITISVAFSRPTLCGLLFDFWAAAAKPLEAIPHQVSDGGGIFWLRLPERKTRVSRTVLNTRYCLPAQQDV